MDTTQAVYIIELVETNVKSNYASFAILAFLVYDTVLLFSDEVKYFWTPKKAISYLYFVTRYSGFYVPISQFLWNVGDATPKVTRNDWNTSCTLAALSGILDPLLLICIDYILLLRVRALYLKGRVITAVLAIAFIIDTISLIAFAVESIIESKPQPLNLAPGFTFCFMTISQMTAVSDAISWSLPLVYGILLMSLAVYKTAKILKEEPGMNNAKLIRIIILDQIAYFWVLLFVSVGSILINFAPLSTPVYVISNSLGSVAILSSVGAHLLLHMKEAGAKGLNEGMGSSVFDSRTTISDMDFTMEIAAGQVSVSLEEDGTETFSSSSEQ